MNKQKINSFKKEIRKSQLQSIFSKKRKEIHLRNIAQQQKDLTPQILLKYSPHQMNQTPMGDTTKNESLTDTNQQFAQNKNLYKSIDKEVYQYSNLNSTIILEEKTLLSVEELISIARFSYNQTGIQCLQRTSIPRLILPFLSPQYYNTLQQKYTTLIFGNLTYFRPNHQPSEQFLRHPLNIIENTSQELAHQNGISENIEQEIVDNCLLIVYNLMLQFEGVVRFYVEEAGLVNLAWKMMEAGAHNPDVIQQLLKILALLHKYFNNKNNSISQEHTHRSNAMSHHYSHNFSTGSYLQTSYNPNGHIEKPTDPKKYPMRRFLKHYITIIQNINEKSFIFLCLRNIRFMLDYYSFSPSCGELFLIQEQIVKSFILKKLYLLYPYLIKPASQNISQNTLLNQFWTTHHIILKVLIRLVGHNLMAKAQYAETLRKLLEKIIDELWDRPDKHPNLGSMNTLKIGSNHAQSLSKMAFQSNASKLNHLRLQFLFILQNYLLSHKQSHQKLLSTSYPFFQKFYSLYQETFENPDESREQMSLMLKFLHILGLLVISGVVKRRTYISQLDKKITYYEQTTMKFVQMGQIESEQDKDLTNFWAVLRENIFEILEEDQRDSQI